MSPLWKHTDLSLSIRPSVNSHKLLSTRNLVYPKKSCLEPLLLKYLTETHQKFTQIFIVICCAALFYFLCPISHIRFIPRDIEIV